MADIIVAGCILGFFIFMFQSFAMEKTIKRKLSQDDELKAKLKSLLDFDSTMTYIAHDRNSGIAIDEQSKKICLITSSFNNADSWRVISYKDVISVELFEDGSLIGQMSALSGKTQTSKKINRIELRLTVNDINNPLHNIIFLNLNKKELIYDEKSKNEALQLVRRWYGIIEVVIKQANDKKEIGSLANELKIAPKLAIVSIADEIKKLADLHSAGILTLEEFQQQKTKLLGKQ